MCNVTLNTALRPALRVRTRVRSARPSGDLLGDLAPASALPRVQSPDGLFDHARLRPTRQVCTALAGPALFRGSPEKVGSPLFRRHAKGHNARSNSCLRHSAGIIILTIHIQP